ncbi:CLUMA_CG005385, isoform A [Clunio marinus]|uniref:CLUMA_CG005385, isoform A n=1 Tax=Clunio marinus TaxID=568069 RepID=A0A1J1HUK8_9DIPT|nr:CLUMA_CG005385, isoform A [Clunio marinus]
MTTVWITLKLFLLSLAEIIKLYLITKLQEFEDLNNPLTLKIEAAFDKLNISEKMEALIMFMYVLRESSINQLNQEHVDFKIPN